MHLNDQKQIYIQQTLEPFEFVGFETRNKYLILNQQSQQIGFAAEQRKGLLDTLLRQFLGHWRSFEVSLFNPHRQKLYSLHHPFRFYFYELNITNRDGQLVGSIQRRFGILSKNFDILNERGQVVFTLRAGLFRIWKFPILRRNQEVANITKKMGKILTEVFTDKDLFQINCENSTITEQEKLLLIALTLMIDLKYFENNKANIIDVFD